MAMSVPGKSFKSTTYVIPKLFGAVEPQLWRSGTPTVESLPYLATLKLKTVLCLSLEVPTPAVRRFLEANGVSLRHLGLELWQPDLSWRPLSEPLLHEALSVVLQQASYPLLVYCITGTCLTGAVVGLIRKVQGWCFSA
eukprot:RCo027470